MIIVGDEASRAASNAAVLSRVQAVLKQISDIVASIVIITSFLSIVVGAIVTRVYLSHYEIVLLPYDFVNVMVFQIFFIYFINVLSTLIVFLLLPLGASYFVGAQVREILPNLFGWRYIPPKLPKSKAISLAPDRPAVLLSRGTIAGFALEYFIFYLPTLAFCWIWPLEAALGLSAQPEQALLVWFASLIAAGMLLYLLRIRNKGGAFETYWSLFILNCFTMLWLAILMYAGSRLTEYELGQAITVEYTIVPLVVTIFHCAFSWFRFVVRVLGGLVVCMVALLALFPGYATLGAVALREAQMGGGMRVSYFANAQGETKHPEPEEGCLIFATPKYIFMGYLQDGTCPLPTRSPFSNVPIKRRPLRVFPRDGISFSQVAPSP